MELHYLCSSQSLVLTLEYALSIANLKEQNSFAPLLVRPALPVPAAFPRGLHLLTLRFFKAAKQPPAFDNRHIQSFVHSSTFWSVL
eukprot:s1152_g20.t1